MLLSLSKNGTSELNAQLSCSSLSDTSDRLFWGVVRSNVFTADDDCEGSV